MRQKGKIKTVLIHFSVWILYILYELLTIFKVGGIPMSLWETFLNFGLYALLFYAVYLYILPRYLERKKYALFAISIMLVFALFTFIRYHLKISILPFFVDEMINPYTTPRLFLAETLWRGGYFIILSFGFWISKSLIRAERDKRILQENEIKNERKLREIEVSLREAEIEFLKNQINPHFLFNTLNFFYDQVRSCSESTAEGVLLLANIMRYALKGSDVNAKVMLEDEVKHVQDFISINQLRFGNRLQINFEIIGRLQFRMIIPLVLITFVENCFKYGDLFDPQHPILIRLELGQEELLFITSNKKKLGPIEQSTGIGLENTRRRLELVYANRHTLTISDKKENFTATLHIQL